MRTSLHLVSMPLAYELHPSCQLGYLHAFVEKQFRDTVAVASHSAFWEILYDFEGGKMVDFYVKYRFNGEEIFFLLCCFEMFPRAQFRSVLSGYNAAVERSARISEKKLTALQASVESYLEHKLIPTLQQDGINVVGFSTTFSQLFASIFAAKYIERHTDKEVLFVFGGASMSLPEASRTLKLWGVDALMVAGSGEPPLTQILQTCLDSPLNRAQELLTEIDTRDLVNVTRAGSPMKPITLGTPKGFLETLPVPTYDEFFAGLRSVCEDQGVYTQLVDRFVSIPIEGSRGCFAKCDFCQIPGITTQFRTLKGETVATQATELCDKYGKQDVVFIDSVCNAWAEDYADTLLSRNRTIAAFMEMRVHAPEKFWTKLALSGVKDMQLGVEAISEPLLRKMNKGTTVIQNLRASKYLAELGVKSSSNLIILHPKSERSDVDETKRLLELVDHFPPFMLSKFEVSYGSPIYEALEASAKEGLVRGFDWLPADLRDRSFPKDLSYVYPREWMAPEVVEAWLNFRQWHNQRVAALAGKRPTFAVERSSADELSFVDSRFGEQRKYSLRGAPAHVYGLCHEGLTVTEIERATDLSRVVAEAIVADLESRRMLARIGDRYLSLALRTRSELVDNLSLPSRKGKRLTTSLAVVMQ